jgi:Protein of unknown function (DUF2934)
MEHTLEHRIRQRAYEIWHAHGRADGKANEHWLAAEREVLSSLHAPASDASPRKTANPTRTVGQRSAKSRKTSAVERTKS